MDYAGNSRISGVVPAVVIDNEDPEGRYRVKVMFPQWSCDDSRFASGPVNESGFISGWARVATFMSGPDRGAFFLPEVDDEVLVCFEQGDVRFPYIVGSLWNGVDKPINVCKEQDGDKNNFRSIRSRSGHVLTFVDDKKGNEEKIILQTVTKDGEMAEKDPANRDDHFIVLDQGKEKIEIRDTTKKILLFVIELQLIVVCYDVLAIEQLLWKKRKNRPCVRKKLAYPTVSIEIIALIIVKWTMTVLSKSEVMLDVVML